MTNALAYTRSQAATQDSTSIGTQATYNNRQEAATQRR